MTYQLPNRPRRLRSSNAIRALVEETRLTIDDFVLPVFVTEETKPSEISSMPGVFCWPVSGLGDQLRNWREMGIRAFALFPKIDPQKKDDQGSEILNHNALVYRASKSIKDLNLDILLIADLALDPYTNHGHDGVLNADGTVDNDRTVEILADTAVVCANAGFDWVAPSDMMDGRIGSIRKTLEDNQQIHIRILAYSAKYASAYYGPFRDAVGSSGNLGASSKDSYQMDIANSDEALHEVALDLAEGADMVMIKPGMPYLDIVSRVKRELAVPTFVYQVSGEYAMHMAAFQNGWLDKDRIALESLIAIKRAGADGILTYFAKHVGRLLQQTG